jgi:hypothetical protein
MAVVQGVGYGLTAGAIAGAACEGGWLAALATGGSIFATGEAFAAVVESGGEGFVDYAISQADTQEQARDYADVAMSWVEAGATGLAVFGAFKAVRGISAKAAALRTNYPKSKIDNTFQLKHTNPLELETRINQSIIGSIENIPGVMMEKSRIEFQAYKTQLAFEEAGILTKDLKLTPTYVQKILTTPDPESRLGLKHAVIEGAEINNPRVKSILEGSGKPVDFLENWFKFKTDSVLLPSGESRQIHGYINRITGELNYDIDFKISDSPELTRILFGNMRK